MWRVLVHHSIKDRLTSDAIHALEYRTLVSSDSTHYFHSSTLLLLATSYSTSKPPLIAQFTHPTMLARRLVLTEPYGHLYVAAFEPTEPKDAEVLIANKATSLNHLDWKRIDKNLFIPSVPHGTSCECCRGTRQSSVDVTEDQAS